MPPCPPLPDIGFTNASIALLGVLGGGLVGAITVLYKEGLKRSDNAVAEALKRAEKAEARVDQMLYDQANTQRAAERAVTLARNNA